MRIAICDDEAVFRTYLRDILVKDSLARGTDIQVAEYADGEALLEALEAPDDYVDVVFLDIRMPGMDGLETAQAILEEHPEAKIVMVSSLAYDDTIDEAKSIGTKTFIYKPFEKEQLLSTLDEMLGGE